MYCVRKCCPHRQAVCTVLGSVVHTDRQYVLLEYTETWPREETVEDTSVCPKSTHKFLLVWMTGDKLGIHRVRQHQ